MTLVDCSAPRLRPETLAKFKLSVVVPPLSVPFRATVPTEELLMSGSRPVVSEPKAPAGRDGAARQQLDDAGETAGGGLQFERARPTTVDPVNALANSTTPPEPLPPTTSVSLLL